MDTRHSYNNMKTVFQDGAFAFKNLVAPGQSQKDDFSMGTARSLSIQGLYQNDAHSVNYTEYSKYPETFQTRQDEYLQDSDRPSSIKSMIAPRLFDSDREVKDWMKIRDQQNKQSKVDLVGKMQKALNRTINLSQLPFLKYFDELRMHDQELASMTLDFVTEIWMYDLVLYSTVSHVKNLYNLARTQ